MTQSATFAPGTRFKIADSIFHSDVDGEKVILSIKEGAYYGLEEIGARIWNLLAANTFIEIRDIIVKEYKVENAECEADLQELIEELAEANLIEIVDA